MNTLIRFLFGARLPIAACLISALLAGAAVWKFQAMRYEARLARAQAALVSYRAKIASANARLEKAQARVVTRVEVRYRDRIRVIKEKGDAIIKEVPVMCLQKIAPALGLTLVSCAATTPHSPVSLPAPPPSLTENPPAFRLLRLPKPTPSTPESADNGKNRR